MQDKNESNETAANGCDDSDEFEGLTLRDVVGGAVLVIVAVGVAAGFYVYSNVSKDSVRLQFWVSFMFSFAALVIVIIQVTMYAQQSRFMRKQTKTLERQVEKMEEALTIERTKTNPRLRIAEVRVRNLEVGGEPTFIVTIVNDGFVDAPEVRFNMQIDFGKGDFLEFADESPFPVPAREREFKTVTDRSRRLTEQTIAGFNSSMPLIVRGYIDFWNTGPKPFCFKFQPWPQGEDKRPEGVRQFITCSSQARLTHVVTPEPAILHLTTSAPKLVTSPVPPKETKPEEKTDPESEGEGQNPK